MNGGGDIILSYQVLSSMISTPNWNSLFCIPGSEDLSHWPWSPHIHATALDRYSKYVMLYCIHPPYRLGLFCQSQPCSPVVRAPIVWDLFTSMTQLCSCASCCLRGGFAGRVCGEGLRGWLEGRGWLARPRRTGPHCPGSCYLAPSCYNTTTICRL